MYTACFCKRDDLPSILEGSRRPILDLGGPAQEFALDASLTRSQACVDPDGARSIRRVHSDCIAGRTRRKGRERCGVLNLVEKCQDFQGSCSLVESKFAESLACKAPERHFSFRFPSPSSSTQHQHQPASSRPSPLSLHQVKSSIDINTYLTCRLHQCSPPRWPQWPVSLQPRQLLDQLSAPTSSSNSAVSLVNNLFSSLQLSRELRKSARSI